MLSKFKNWLIHCLGGVTPDECDKRILDSINKRRKKKKKSRGTFDEMGILPNIVMMIERCTRIHV